MKGGLIQRLRGAFRSGNPVNSLSGSEGWSLFSWGNGSDAAELVNEETALSVATVYACVRVLSESVASLPLRLYKLTATGRQEALDLPLTFLLRYAPNDEMTSYTLFEVMVKSLALCGNSYVEIERDGKGNPIALWPLHPRQTFPIRLPNGRIAYRTRDGMTGAGERQIAAADMLHVPLFPSFDGLVGLSPLELTRQTIGHEIAAQKMGARWFANFSVPAVAIEIAEEVSPKDKAEMRQQWEQLQSGSNSHRVAILDQGMKLTKLSLTPEESQFIETRGFNRTQIAAIYRVPVHMVGDNQRLSQASVTELNLSFVQDSLRPFLSRIEAEIVRKLLRPMPDMPVQYVCEFDCRERLRGDATTAASYYRTAIQWGWMNPNEVRAEENMNQGPDALSQYVTPVNMQNSERLLDTESIQDQPLPAKPNH
jgi:HK97 family phage portal protein